MSRIEGLRTHVFRMNNTRCTLGLLLLGLSCSLAEEPAPSVGNAGSGNGSGAGPSAGGSSGSAAGGSAGTGLGGSAGCVEP
ncbi:MAG TPA: hypothetical protein VM686_13740, partial [Polyangiaceae bacterium]|nr:hypothetical protein [Polyangiaceae bacterium]